MSAGDIYAKTPLGMQEVGNRKMKLSPRLRTMLILVDGHLPEFMLKEDGQKIGAAADFLDELVALGLVAKTGSATAAKASEQPAAGEVDEYARFRVAKDFMNVSVVNALGIKSFFFTLKLERAGTLSDLRDLIEPYREAIAKASGAAEAEVLASRVRVLVG